MRHAAALFSILLASCQPCVPQRPVTGRHSDVVSSLSLEAKVGQMLQVRAYADFEDTSSPEFVATLAMLTKYHVGSLDLRNRLVGPNLLRPIPRRIAQTVNAYQKATSIPLLVSSDIERGLIARTSGSPDIPNAMAWGAAGDPLAAKRSGEISAREGRAIGIQWALAPVADVNDDPENSVIGDRSFGEDAALVSRMVAAYIEGAHAGGMLVTAKHFPGHGGTAFDSHVGIVTLNKSLNHLRKIEFAPFRSAIASGADVIMLAHERVPALDPDPNKIATTSAKMVQGYLREELGFRGVVMTDAMDMKGVTDLYKDEAHPEGRAVVDAVKAGVDIVMLADHVDEAYGAILNAVRSGDISESRIDESVRRILAMKEKVGLFSHRFVDEDKVSEVFSRVADFDFAQEMANNAVMLVQNKGFALPMEAALPNTLSKINRKPGKLSLVLFTDSIRSPLGRTFEDQFRQYCPTVQVRHIYYNNRATWETTDAVSLVQDADFVVVAVFMTSVPGRKAVAGEKIVNVFGLDGTSAQLFNQILLVGGKKVMVVSLGSPYLILHYPTIENYACTFSVSSTSERAAVKALFGYVKNKAKLPVNLPGVAALGSSVEWPQNRTAGS